MKPAYSSISSIGNLLLTNSEFRIFLGDVTTVGREVFRDAALSLSAVSKEVGEEVAPPEAEGSDASHLMETDHAAPPSPRDFADTAADVSSTVASGAATVARDTTTSVSEHVSHDERDILLSRLKKAVLNLRQKPDYDESVSMLSVILRRCAKAYARTLAETAEALEEDLDRNREADLALFNFWKFVTSIGDQYRWNEVQQAFRSVLEHASSDPDFERRVDEIGALVQAMLTDPAFYDNPEKRFRELRERLTVKTSSDLWKDMETLFAKLRLAITSMSQDKSIKRITDTAKRIATTIQNTNTHDLTTDCINTLIPTLLSAIQHIPIPRLELSTPAADLLLENLILEPGTTPTATSFFPHRTKLTTQTSVEVRKGHARTTSRLSTLVRISLSGISVATEDVGYWLRYHSGLLRFGSEGIASVELDRRGVDVVLDLEIGRDRIDELVAVRNVRVKIHRFNYKLRKTNMSWLGWLFKPFLRPLIGAMLEHQVASAIRDACVFANRELLFARERLRATRIADPGDMWTFVRAVSARLAPRPDADLDVRVGVDEPGKGVFEGVYAPGSLVRVWNEEGEGAGQRVREARRDGWRNRIFDV